VSFSHHASKQSSASNFIDFNYKRALGAFCFLHHYYDDLIFMEGGAPIHYGTLPRPWRQAHSIRKLN
jgi:hypothetical protein